MIGRWVSGGQRPTYADAEDLAAGETFPSRTIAMTSSGGTVPTGTGNLRLVYGTARRNEPITRLRIGHGATAGTTQTLVRWGVYSQAVNGDLALVASTVNDATLFTGAGNAEYEKLLSATWNKVKGQRYAFGVLVVTAGVAPTLAGSLLNLSVQPNLARGPRVLANVPGQADLPGTVVVASLAVSASMFWVEAAP